MAMKRKTFENLCTELDATLLPYRVRIAYQKGVSRNTLAKQFNIKPKRVTEYIQNEFVANAPKLPRAFNPKASRIWGIPCFKISCSEKRLNRPGQSIKRPRERPIPHLIAPIWNPMPDGAKTQMKGA